MNHVCTLYIDNVKLGTISTWPNDPNGISFTNASNVRFVSTSCIYVLSDVGVASRVDLQVANKETVDEPLKKLSTNPYIIITDNRVMLKDKVYKAITNIPMSCRWRAIPMIKEIEYIPYKKIKDIDDIFLGQGYARELSDASNILVLPSMDEFSSTCTPLDLLIKGVSKDSYTSYSGRSITIPEDAILEREGRYLYINIIPMLEGSLKDTPYTYNGDSLILKCNILQTRINEYGQGKVQSLCKVLNTLGDRVKEIPNQYEASSLYNDIFYILDKIRNMSQ